MQTTRGFKTLHDLGKIDAIRAHNHWHTVYGRFNRIMTTRVVKTAAYEGNFGSGI
jgi:hypothetical protein